MRIISGNFKGKKLIEPNDKLTRPLKDLTKESIFNILVHSKLIHTKLENSNILDLFSGTGSFGLECLSRGANSVTFFENYPSVIKILQKNISNLKYETKTKIIEKNIFDDKNLELIKEEFEIVFLDPPYKEKKLSRILQSILENKILSKNGIIIIHRHKKEKDELPINFKVIKENIYGVSKIIFGN